MTPPSLCDFPAYLGFTHAMNGPLRIAVITPCQNTPQAWLDQCRHSVLAQTLPCTHILVNDGGDSPHVDTSGSLQIIHLPQPHQDVGNAGRAIGSVTAICQDFDALAYLDSDNWYEPAHLQTLVNLQRATGAAVCSSTRNLHQLDGTLLGRCPEVDGERFVDTNCLFLMSAAFSVVAAWYMTPRGQALATDRVVWQTIKNLRLRRAHTGLPTVAYRTNYRVHYDHFGVTAPAGAKLLVWDPALQRMVARSANPSRDC
jgi:glycosyltransferase involved in cell wall biosynthesis